MIHEGRKITTGGSKANHLQITMIRIDENIDAISKPQNQQEFGTGKIVPICTNRITVNPIVPGVSRDLATYLGVTAC